MEHLALEKVQALQVWPGRLIELSGGGDEYVGGQLLTVCESHRPLICFVVKRGFLHLGVKPDVTAQAIFLNAVLHIPEYFGLQSEFPRPVVLGFEGV